MDNPDVAGQIQAFTARFHESFEIALQEHGRNRFPYHAEPCVYVLIYKAADGFVTFYLPENPHVTSPGGQYYGDLSNYTLNAICETLHLHRLKVATQDIGEEWRLQLIPPDVEAVPELEGHILINLQIQEAARAGRISHLPGMTITPTYWVKQGIIKRIVPGVKRILSPVVQIEGLGELRLYHWTHADFWWMPEALDLDVEKAPEFANSSVYALGAILSSEAPLDTETASKDIGSSSAELLENCCNEFYTLLDNQGNNEESLHQWLFQKEHHIFLDFDVIEVRSKVQFGNEFSDFVVKHSNGSYTLIEIEPATAPIFQQRRAEPTSQFHHACNQVEGWQQYVRNHVHHVREVNNLPGIYEPNGMVIIGRDASIRDQSARDRWRDLQQRRQLKLATYDEIGQRVRNLAKQLSQLSQQKKAD